MNNSKIYTLDEAAKMLGVNRDNLRRVIARGELRGFKRFAKWYILHSDIIQYIQAGKDSTGKK